MDRIGSLLDRPKQYYNIDGVGELGIGFMLLGYGLLGWMQVHTPEHSVWNQMYTLFLYVGLMVAIIHYGSKAIKTHITYPRTGFVEYRTRDRIGIPLLVSLAFSLLAAVVLVLALRRHWDLTVPLSLVGFLLAACYAHGIARAVRWKWVVAWLLAFAPLLIAALPADLVGALAKGSWITPRFPARLVGAVQLTIMFYGTVFLLSGGMSFWLYLHHTQAPAREPQ